MCPRYFGTTETPEALTPSEAYPLCRIVACGNPPKDGKLKGCFEYMVSNKHRFFQWVRHPEVEAENNLAVRRLRPMVIARKVCFGSQSD